MPAIEEQRSIGTCGAVAVTLGALLIVFVGVEIFLRFYLGNLGLPRMDIDPDDAMLPTQGHEGTRNH
jgi:hypothetical protein